FGRRVPLGGDYPVATAGLAAFGEGTGDVDGATLAGGDRIDRPVLGMQPAHPHGNAARADRKPVTLCHATRSHGAGYYEPDPGQGEGAVDRHPKETR